MAFRGNHGGRPPFPGMPPPGMGPPGMGMAMPPRGQFIRPPMPGMPGMGPNNRSLAGIPNMNLPSGVPGAGIINFSPGLLPSPYIPTPVVAVPKSDLPHATTAVNLYVGNISDLVADTLVHQVLQKCGEVNTWKRVRGDSGKPKAFGFCEYTTPDGASRAMRILPSILLADKNIKPNANAATKTIIEEFEVARRQQKVKESKKTEEEVNKQEAAEDETVKEVIAQLVKDYLAEAKESGALSLREQMIEAQKKAEMAKEREREREKAKEKSKESKLDLDAEIKAVRDREREKEREEKSRSAEKTMKEKEERKRKDLERSYKDMERKLATKEKDRIKSYIRTKDKDEDRELQALKEAKKELDHMAVYDDDKDDSKYYSGRELQRKRAYRERELELDEKDRQEEEETLRALEPVGPPPPETPEETTSSSATAMEVDDPHANTSTTNKPEKDESTSNENGYEAKRGKVDSIFDTENEAKQQIHAQQKPKKPAVTAFNEENLRKSGLNTEQIGIEKKRIIKLVIESIPTSKEKLFAVDLEPITMDLVNRRVLPWVNKKIVNYIGEEEPTLAEFICEKVMQNTPPHEILADVEQVLDEEATVFMVKLWRLLVFETEATKLGVN